jgi:hypothetical protein
MYNEVRVHLIPQLDLALVLCGLWQREEPAFAVTIVRALHDHGDPVVNIVGIEFTAIIVTQKPKIPQKMPKPELAVVPPVKLQATCESDQHFQERTTELHPVPIYPDIFQLRPFKAQISSVFCSVVIAGNMPDELRLEELS